MAANNTFSPFPNILASPEDKEKDEYGIKYARAIWSSYNNNILQFNAQRQRDILNRQYAEGLQTTQIFKDRKGVTNTSFSNLDYTPLSIIPTIIDNVVGRLMNTSYKIQCNAIDPESKSRFDDYRNKLYADMFLKPFSDDIQKLTGLPLVSRQSVPETNEEAELHLKLNYKEDASIAMEQAFNYIFSSNSFDTTSKEQLLRDLLVLKRCAIQRYYDENYNIRVERIDPVDIITPYSKYDDFRNIPYVALIKQYTVGEIVAKNKGRFTEEEIFKIAQSAGGKNNNPPWNYGLSYEGYYNNIDAGVDAPYYNFNIQVLEFYFLGIDKESREFKKAGNRKYTNKVGSDFIPKDGKSEMISKQVQNVYEGSWIINTPYIYNYKKCYNIPREKINGSYSPKASLPIKIIAPGIYDMQNKSHVERMIPHEDQMMLAGLALQNALIKAKPPGINVNVNGLINAAKALGGTMTEKDIIKMYEETGNLLYADTDETGGNPINSKIVEELAGGVSSAINDYLAVDAFQRQRMNEVIGYNSAVDASTPNANMLVGVQDNAIAATNNSLRTIFNSFIKILESTAKEVALMVQDSLEYNNEAFYNAIGTEATKTLEYGKKLAFVQMGIKIELLPDENEKLDIIQTLNNGVLAGTLTSSDKIRIMEVLKQDVKYAARLLVFLEEKNRKNRMQEAERASMVQAQSAAEASKVAAESNAQAQMQIEQFKQESLKIEYALKGQLSAQEHQQKIQEIIVTKQGDAAITEKGNEGKVHVQYAANAGKEAVADKNHQSKILTEAFKNSTSTGK